MFGCWRHLLLLSIEPHCVITMRTIRLAIGGTSALDEAAYLGREDLRHSRDPSCAVYEVAPDAGCGLSQIGQKQSTASLDELQGPSDG
jgi:hypothetical protein